MGVNPKDSTRTRLDSTNLDSGFDIALMLCRARSQNIRDKNWRIVSYYTSKQNKLRMYMKKFILVSAFDFYFFRFMFIHQ